MKQLFTHTILILLFSFLQQLSFSQELLVMKTAYFPAFSSASSIELFNDRLYIIGDDAPMMIITDTGYRVIDSIRLVRTNQKRISKEQKPDLESSFIYEKNNKQYLAAIGSFSTAKRNKVYQFQLDSDGIPGLPKVQEPVIGKQETAWLNIEGAAFINGKVILSNRANNTNRLNYLLVTNLRESGLILNDFKAIPFLLPPKSKVTGISGLYYIKEEDLLLFSASTEDTPNAYTDGAIGESYIGYIRNISSRLDDKAIHADKLISLSIYLGQQGAVQKIESIVAEPRRDGSMVIYLAADNDNGTSTLYKMSWKF